MQYSYKITLLKGAKYFVIFLLPFLVNQFVVEYPQYAQLTVGGLLVMLCNYAKVKLDVKFP